MIGQMIRSYVLTIAFYQIREVRIFTRNPHLPWLIQAKVETMSSTYDEVQSPSSGSPDWTVWMIVQRSLRLQLSWQTEKGLNSTRTISRSHLTQVDGGKREAAVLKNLRLSDLAAARPFFRLYDNAVRDVTSGGVELRSFNYRPLNPDLPSCVLASMTPHQGSRLDNQIKASVTSQK